MAQGYGELGEARQWPRRATMAAQGCKGQSKTKKRAGRGGLTPPKNTLALASWLGTRCLNRQKLGKKENKRKKRWEKKKNAQNSF